MHSLGWCVHSVQLDNVEMKACGCCSQLIAFSASIIDAPDDWMIIFMSLTEHDCA